MKPPAAGSTRFQFEPPSKFTSLTAFDHPDASATPSQSTLKETFKDADNPECNHHGPGAPPDLRLHGGISTRCLVLPRVIQLDCNVEDAHVVVAVRVHSHVK